MAESQALAGGLQAAPEEVREPPEHAGGRRPAPRLRAIAHREVGDQRRAEVDGEAGVGPLLEPRRHRRKQQHHAEDLGPPRLPRLLPGGALGGRWPGGVGLGGGHRRALGALVLLLAPPAGRRRAPETRPCPNATPPSTPTCVRLPPSPSRSSSTCARWCTPPAPRSRSASSGTAPSSSTAARCARWPPSRRTAGSVSGRPTSSARVPPPPPRWPA